MFSFAEDPSMTITVPMPAAAPVLSGARLRAARESAGLTREQLAVLVGRSAQSVALWERGTVTPNVRVLAVVAEALGIQLTSLLTAPAGTEE